MKVDEVLLVNVSGRNSAGLMTMLTSSLAEFQVRVLDIGQSVIHDELNLGLLAQLNSAQNIESLERKLTRRLAQFNANVRFTRVKRADYASWVANGGRPRHIVTMLATAVSAEQLAALTRAIERSGLSIDGIRRLSGRVPIVYEESEESCRQDHGRVSIELSIRGEMAASLSLREDLLSVAGQHDFDCSIQKDSVYRRNRRLVAFDMDSTLIRQEVIDEMAVAAGVGEQVADITRRAMRGEMDFKESFRQRVALLKGMLEAAMGQIAQAVELTDGAHKLVQSLKNLGYTTAIISGGLEFVAQHLKKKLAIDYVFANQIEIEAGVATGQVRGEIIDAVRKADLLKELCTLQGIDLQQTIAIGDGANDLPMLSVAGMGVAFHAKPLVRESADHAISSHGLDCVLYLMGFSDSDVNEMLP